MFNFIFDETTGEYSLWWDSFEHKIGSLYEFIPGVWKCCPQWQAHYQLGLPYREIRADTKEGAARVWLTEVEHGV